MLDCHSIVGLYTYQNRVPCAPSLRWVSCEEREKLLHQGANFHSSVVHYPILGLPAKPIIDIMVGAERRHWPAIVQALKRIAYVHWEDNPDTNREFLVKGMPPFGTRRTHHVHICEVGGPLWERLLFRDYLQHHAEDRLAYATLKQRLAAAYPEDREAYTRGRV